MKHTDARDPVAVPVLGILLLATCAFLVAQLFSGAASIAWSGLCLTLVGSASAVIVGGRGVGSALAGLRLGSWFAIGFAATFGAATIALAFASGAISAWTRSFVSDDVLVAVVPLLAAFILVSAASYRVLPEDWTAAINRRSASWMGRERDGYGAPIALLCVGVLAEAVLAVSGTLGYASDAGALVSSADPLTNVLTQLGRFSLLVTFWMGWRFAQTRALRALGLAVLATMISVAIGLASGMKVEAALPLIVVSLGFSGARRRLNWPMLAAILVVFIALIYPFVSAYRDAISTNAGRLTPQQAIGELGSVGVSTDGQQIGGTLDSLTARSARIRDFLVIESKTPDPVQFRAFSELAMAPVLGVVPRVVWPSKPVLAVGYEFAVDYYGQDRGTYSASAVTPVGDLYRHGGEWVVILGAVTIGLLLRAIDSVSQGFRDPRAYFLAVLLLPSVFKHEIDYATFVAGVVGNVVIFALAVIAGRAAATADAPSSAPVSASR